MMAWKSMQSTVMLAGLALVLVLARANAADSTPQVRVRKELRNLNDTELDLFVMGLSTMLAVGTEQGQQLFGPEYKEYNYFINKHSLTNQDPRGDQGHGGPCFMTFHRAFVLEFELSLLSVVPDLKALPYWDITKDVRGGAYNTSNPKYMFSKNYAGAVTGDPSRNYTVTDGIFSNHQLSYYSSDKYGNTSQYYNGSLTTGLLRSPNNNNTNLYVTRYPYSFNPPYNYYVPDIQPNEFPMAYTEADYTYCHNPVRVTNWDEWIACVDLTALLRAGAIELIDSILNYTHAPLLHTSPHTTIGGLYGGTRGDFMDVATSPNEVLLFMIHHANLDRSNMIWQQASATLNPIMASKDVLWNYPVNSSQAPAVEGCFLHDVINLLGPFTSIFPGVQPEQPEGFTHADVLWNTRPEVNLYTYDNMYTASTTTTTAPTRRRLRKQHRSRRHLH